MASTDLPMYDTNTLDAYPRDAKIAQVLGDVLDAHANRLDTILLHSCVAEDEVSCHIVYNGEDTTYNKR